MKFNELSEIWNSADLELEKSLQINKELVKEISMTKIKSSLYEIKLGSIIEIVVWAIFLFFLMGFIQGHFSDLKFLVPAFILLAITLYNLVFEIYRMRLFYSVNSRSSVMEAQKKLARLKYLELLDRNSLYVIIPLFAVPFFIVVAKAFLNFSIYTFDTSWLISFTAGSVLVAVIIAYFLKKYPNKKLVDSIAFLDELKENEK